jgi:hypothetical protein
LHGRNFKLPTANCPESRSQRKFRQPRLVQYVTSASTVQYCTQDQELLTRYSCQDPPRTSTVLYVDCSVCHSRMPLPVARQPPPIGRRGAAAAPQLSYRGCLWRLEPKVSSPFSSADTLAVDTTTEFDLLVHDDIDIQRLERRGGRDDLSAALCLVCMYATGRHVRTVSTVLFCAAQLPLILMWSCHCRGTGSAI